MKTAVFLEALNGGDWLPSGCSDSNLAGAARLATDQHGARAALAFTATILCAGQA
jgi:hypothetical protein